MLEFGTAAPYIGCYGLRFFGYASVRPFLYLDPPTLLRPEPYFDFLGQTLLWPKLYTSRPIRSPDLTKARSTEVEVSESKYASRSK